MVGALQAHHLQPHTTAKTQPKSNHNHHHGQNPAKIKSQQRPRSPPIKSQNHEPHPPKSQIKESQNHNKDPNQITPIEIKAQNPQNNQNHKIKRTHPR